MKSKMLFEEFNDSFFGIGFVFAPPHEDDENFFGEPDENDAFRLEQRLMDILSGLPIQFGIEENTHAIDKRASDPQRILNAVKSRLSQHFDVIVRKDS
jgi:hypothetical protein